MDMRSKNLRVGFLLLLVVVLMSTTVAFAKVDSYVNITANQTGAWGYTRMYAGSTGNLYGWNSSDSTNVLYCATDTGATYRTMRMVIGSGVCTQTGFAIVPGSYRVVLDPSGPNASGCIGYGSFWQ